MRGSIVSYGKKAEYSLDAAAIFKNLYSSSIAYSDELEYIVAYPYGDAVAEAGTISPFYNCHAFALHFKGVKPLESTAIYITDPNIYFTDGSLIETNINDVKNGDIIAYYNDSGLIPTGIVSDSTTKTLDGLKIRSKDGDGFILNHLPRACSYYLGDNSKIKFYRWNHRLGTVSSYNDTVHYYQCTTCADNTYAKHSILYTKTDSTFSHLKSCTLCSYQISEGHDYAQGGLKYKCSKCGFLSSFKPITPGTRSLSGILFICSYDESQTPRTYNEMITYLRVNNYNDLLEEFNDFYNNLNK